MKKNQILKQKQKINKYIIIITIQTKVKNKYICHNYNYSNSVKFHRATSCRYKDMIIFSMSLFFNAFCIIITSK